jgi:hypothetical protein
MKNLLWNDVKTIDVLVQSARVESIRDMVDDFSIFSTDVIVGGLQKHKSILQTVLKEIEKDPLLRIA